MMIRQHASIRAAVLLAVAGGLGPAAPAGAQSYAEQLPPALQDVGVGGEMLPMDLEFTNEQGESVRLGDFFQSGRPVILTPVFYECPMLCTLVLNGMVDGLNDMEWSAGAEFDIVTFSFKVGEAHRLAEVKKRAYLTQYRRDAATDGWHFLVGSEASIDRLTDAIGFRFNPLEDGTIAHTATILFITPDGRISRYMNDVVFKSRDLELALVEAGEGKLGSPLDKIALFMCFQYDPDKNSYTWAAWKVMRLGGMLTLMSLAAVLFWLWRRGARNPLADVEAEAIEPPRRAADPAVRGLSS
ncbi:MAG: SCO family protein [Planctomycetota bacterium]|jgi:protein SCO1/2